jgi:hypothetical protein
MKKVYLSRELWVREKWVEWQEEEKEEERRRQAESGRWDLYLMLNDMEDDIIIHPYM